MPKLDKEHLYGQFNKRNEWRHTLAKKATYKALDIPEEDDVNINVQKGYGWKELLVGGAVLLGGGLLASNHFQPPQAAPVDSAYEVRFFDADGNPITVPNVSERAGGGQ